MIEEWIHAIGFLVLASASGMSVKNKSYGWATFFILFTQLALFLAIFGAHYAE